MAETVRSHLPCHCQKLHNTEDDSQAFFMPLKNKTENDYSDCWNVKQKGMQVALKWCIIYLPKTLHRALRQGRAGGRRKEWLPCWQSDVCHLTQNFLQRCMGNAKFYPLLDLLQTFQSWGKQIQQCIYTKSKITKDSIYQHDNGGYQSCWFKHALQLF